MNERKTSPAENVRVLLTKILKEDADGSWYEHRFSGPVQVCWRIPEPMDRTIGPEDYATWASLHEEDEGAELRLYWKPNNLIGAETIRALEPTRLHFKAVSNTAESNEVALDIVWDGEWSEDPAEMARHMNVVDVSP